MNHSSLWFLHSPSTLLLVPVITLEFLPKCVVESFRISLLPVRPHKDEVPYQIRCVKLRTTTIQCLKDYLRIVIVIKNNRHYLSGPAKLTLQAFRTRTVISSRVHSAIHFSKHSVKNQIASRAGG